MLAAACGMIQRNNAFQALVLTRVRIHMVLVVVLHQVAATPGTLRAKTTTWKLRAFVNAVVPSSMIFVGNFMNVELLGQAT
jgi:prolipoprotein diacylglyceryltransferase